MKKIGRYHLGNTYFEMFVDGNIAGGGFSFKPDGKGLPKMVIGIHSKHWSDVVAVALHEILEALASQCDLRYEKSNAWSRGEDRYIFWFNHLMFSEICEQASVPMADMWNDLKKAHREHHRKAKKPKPKPKPSLSSS